MLRVVCYGDSNTVGYDPRSLWGNSYPNDIPWPRQLARKGYDTVNEGLNGRCIPDDLVSYRRTADMLSEDLPADVVTIMLGTNDLLRGIQSGFTASDAAKRMELFLTSAPMRNLAKTTSLLLVAPPQMTRGALTDLPGLLKESKQLGQAYARLAKRLSIDFVDASQWDLPMAYDGTHLLPEGHAQLAEGIATFLEKTWQ